MAPVHGLHEVGALGLGGQPGGRSAPLDVDHQKGQLQADGQPDGLAFEGDARPAGGGHPQVPAERRPQRGAHRGDLVLSLKGADPEILPLAQLMEHIAGRGDGVRTQKQGNLGPLAGSYQTPRQCGVAVHVRVGARSQRGGLHLVGEVEQLSGFAEGHPRLECGRVGVGYELLALELGRDPVQGGLRRTAVEPRQEAEGEEVLGPLGVTGLHPQVLADLFGDGGHRHLEQGVVVEAAVFQRIGLIASLGQVPLHKGVLIDNDGPADLQMSYLLAEGSRIHGDQNAGSVARCADVMVGNLHLERRHPGQRSLRRPDFGGEFRQRGQVVAEQRAGTGEPVTGELHSIAGVARKTNYQAVQLTRPDGTRHGVSHGILLDPRWPLAKATPEYEVTQWRTSSGTSS